MPEYRVEIADIRGDLGLMLDGIIAELPGSQCMAQLLLVNHNGSRELVRATINTVVPDDASPGTWKFRGTLPGSQTEGRQWVEPLQIFRGEYIPDCQTGHLIGLWSARFAA